MKRTLFKIPRICLILLAMMVLSFAVEKPHDEVQKEDYDNQMVIIPLDDIESQRLSHALSYQPDYEEIIPHEEIIYNVKDLTKEENEKKYIPEINNYCGFCLTRLQCGFSCWRVCNSNHDIPRNLCYCYGLKYLNFGTAMITTWILAAANHQIPIGVLIAFTVLSILSLYSEFVDFLSCCCCMVECCWGKTEFGESMDRGRLCLPEDACSCTSLFGYNFYKFGCPNFCCCFDCEPRRDNED